MSQDTLAIGLFLFGAGFTLALAAFCLGVTLFKDDDKYRQSIERRRQLFWLDKLISIQKPEYRGFSYLMHGTAVLLCLSGTAWVLYHQI